MTAERVRQVKEESDYEEDQVDEVTGLVGAHCTPPAVRCNLSNYGRSVYLNKNACFDQGLECCLNV